MVKYWLRLHDDPCGDSLLKEALKDNQFVFNNGQDCWIKCLNTILQDINMMYIFISCSLGRNDRLSGVGI